MKTMILVLVSVDQQCRQGLVFLGSRPGLLINSTILALAVVVSVFDQLQRPSRVGVVVAQVERLLSSCSTNWSSLTSEGLSCSVDVVISIIASQAVQNGVKSN